MLRRRAIGRISNLSHIKRSFGTNEINIDGPILTISRPLRDV